MITLALFTFIFLALCNCQGLKCETLLCSRAVTQLEIHDITTRTALQVPEVVQGSLSLLTPLSLIEQF